MNLSKGLASTAAAALMVAQSAAASAAPVRAASPAAETEALGDSPAALPFLAVFAVFLIAGVVLLVDDDDSPVSP